MSKSHFYENLTSRNYLYIDDSTQQKIRDASIAFLGTGLSSTLAIYCVRLGFTKFMLCDGDRVELSNLNRQSFNHLDINEFKVSALKQQMLSINGACSIVSIPKYFSNIDEFEHILNDYDIIVNTIDLDDKYFDIIEFCRSKNKLAICPFNPGFDGMLINFCSSSKGPDTVFGPIVNPNEITMTRQLLKNYPKINAPAQAKKTLDEFLHASETSHFPQICIGALLTCSMAIRTMVKYLSNQPITLAPEVEYISMD